MDLPGFKVATLPILYRRGGRGGPGRRANCPAMSTTRSSRAVSSLDEIEGEPLKRRSATCCEAADLAIRKGANMLILSDRGVTAGRRRSRRCWRLPACTTT
jgi:hypothetical protein